MADTLHRRALEAIAKSWSCSDYGQEFCAFCGAQVHNAHLAWAGIEPTITHDTGCIVPEVLAHLAANPQEN